MPSTLFSRDPVSRDMLARIGADKRHKNRRFVARNFALDENVSDGRARSYEGAVGKVASDDMDAWQSPTCRPKSTKVRARAMNSGETLIVLTLSAPHRFKTALR